jgi:hypothetical protein
MVGNIGLMVGMGVVVGGAIFLFGKPIRAHRKAGLITGASFCGGGLPLLVIHADSAWWWGDISCACAGGRLVHRHRTARPVDRLIRVAERQRTSPEAMRKTDAGSARRL